MELKSHFLVRKRWQEKEMVTIEMELIVQQILYKKLAFNPFMDELNPALPVDVCMQTYSNTHDEV